MRNDTHCAAPNATKKCVDSSFHTWGGHGLSVNPIAGGKTQVWIADFYRHRVSMFDPEGKMAVKLGTDSSGPADENINNLQFGNVADIAFGKGNAVYVADGDTGHGGLTKMLAPPPR